MMIRPYLVPLGACLLLFLPVLLPLASAGGVESITINSPARAPVEAAVAPGLTTLYQFPGGTKGYFPLGGVAFDSKGNLYGTTQYDGFCLGCGLVYVLKKPSAKNPGWTFELVHLFGKTLQDGIRPSAPLLLHDDVFYSTTPFGANPQCGCGEVFKFTPGGANPDQSYKILHHFGNFKLGWNPGGGVLLGNDGTIYGTTTGGGRHTAGTIFKITAAGDYSVMYDFTGDDFGGGPQGELIFGKDGAIYGTSFGGGKYNQGLIFRITTDGDFTKLYDFLGVNQPGGSHDGANPQGRLALGDDGTIYGTTAFGGSPSGYGTAWSLSPPKGVTKKWQYHQLHIFGSDGNIPHSGLVIDADGVLYGTGAGGGDFQSGVIYKLTRPKSGNDWDYTPLHSFKARDKDGDTPSGDILLRNGTIYGTNISGGDVTNEGDCRDGCGTVFQFNL